MKRVIAVFGASTSTSSDVLNSAIELGRMSAAEKLILLSGGTRPPKDSVKNAAISGAGPRPRGIDSARRRVRGSSSDHEAIRIGGGDLQQARRAVGGAKLECVAVELPPPLAALFRPVGRSRRPLPVAPVRAKIERTPPTRRWEGV
jgi:hypothetical protein